MDLIVIAGLTGTAALMVAEMYAFLATRVYRRRPALTATAIPEAAVSPALSLFVQRRKVEARLYDQAA